MFCYTIANSYHCVLRELLLWSNTAKEHQTFLLSVANLTNKNLIKLLEDQLMRFHEEFAEIEEETMGLYQTIPMKNQRLPYLIRKFLVINTEFIRTLQMLKEYGENDKVWQTLVEHIEDEQQYMGRLLRNLQNQLIF